MKTEDLVLYRKWFTDKSTIGELVYKNEFFCFVLEDTVRAAGEKVYGETAIPMGVYPLSITYSPTFQRQLPLLSDVPMFSGIRCHAGNKAIDTHGCLLLGLSTNHKDAIYKSQDAVRKFMALVREHNIDTIQIIDTKAVAYESQ